MCSLLSRGMVAPQGWLLDHKSAFTLLVRLLRQQACSLLCCLTARVLQLSHSVAIQPCLHDRAWHAQQTARCMICSRSPA